MNRAAKPSLEEAIANIDAERLVIGSLFHTDTESFGRAAELVSEASFSLEKHRLVFAAMREVFNSGKQINYGTVLLELRKNNHHGTVGPLIDLYEGIPGLYNLEAFCDQVAEAERLRKLWLAGQSIQQRVEARDPSQEIAADAEAQLAGSQIRKKAKRASKPSEIIDRAGGQNSFIWPEQGKRILTPWSRVNKRTNGMGQGQLWIVGGISGTGKTSLALNIVQHAIFEQQSRIKIVSREMDAEELLFNLVCTRARVDSQALRARECSKEDERKVQAAMTDYQENMDDFLEIEDEECSTAGAISAALRKNVSEGRPADALVVDYLQLLHGIGRFKDRREEVDQIAYALKEIARNFRIPVLALAQLNTRKLDTEGGMAGAPKPDVKPRKPIPPSLGDFRESGAIEQAADVAWILRRTDVEQQFHKVQLIDGFLLKQRGGRTGKIPFRFHSMYRLFEEVPESSYDHQEAAA